MCCRYYMEMSPRLRPIVEAANRSRLYRSNILCLYIPGEYRNGASLLKEGTENVLLHSEIYGSNVIFCIGGNIVFL